MAEKKKKPKQEFGYIDQILSAIGLREEFAPGPEGFTDLKVDPSKLQVGDKEKSPPVNQKNEKRKKDAITRLKLQQANQSKAKPKKSKNVLIKPKAKAAPKKFNQGGMSKAQLGEHNLMAMNSLFAALDGKGPTALDIASAKKVAEDKVTAGLEATDAPSGFDFDPNNYQGEVTGDPGLKQREAMAMAQAGDSEGLINAAAVEANIEDPQPETIAEAGRLMKNKDAINEIKEKDQSDWSMPEGLAVALAGLVPSLVGYALGGYEGALHGAKGTADAARVYGEIELEREKSASKESKQGKTITLTMNDETGEAQDYLFKFDSNGKLQPVMNPVTGKIATGSKLAEARILSKGKAQIEALKQEGGVKKAEIAFEKWSKGISAQNKRSADQIAAAERRLQMSIDSREKIAAAKQAAQDKKDDEKIKKLPLDAASEVRAMSTGMGKKKNILRQLKGGLKEFLRFVAAGEIDSAVVHGRNLAKTLNSTEGADAVGVEESKKLVGFLRQNIFNLTEPGPMFGRDLEGFSNQLKGKIREIESAVAGTRTDIDSVYAQYGILKPPRKGRKTPKGKSPSKKKEKGQFIGVVRNVGDSVRIKGIDYIVIKKTPNGSYVKRK